jgi:hypothetical protein
MNIYQKYSNNNVIPELLLEGVLIGVLFKSVVGAATIGVLFSSDNISPP